MKAAVIYEHGGHELVRIEDVPEPQCGANEVVLEVSAAGLNHLDIWVTKGRPGLELAMPHTLGCDAAGVVVEVGTAVADVRVGDEVIVNPALSCGSCEYCRAGEQSECVSFGIVGMSRAGTFAARVAVPAKNVYPAPRHMGPAEAGAFALTYVTAWRMLMNRAGLVPGQTVLIHGIGGGVALSALQLARLAGAEVIVTSASDRKLAHARQIGADHTINYRTVADVARTVKDITSGRGVDIVVDAVGAAAWTIDFSAVRRGGKIVLCGVTTGATPETDLRTLYLNQLTVMGSTMGSEEDFRQMLSAVAAAGLTPVIDSVEPLENVRTAMRRMERAEQFGKIVLKPNG
jgi:NADPH:quinone reductase-like Zn-dependent oxidoreductase